MKNKVEVKVQNILNRIRPYLQNDGGDAEFVRFEEETGIVYIKIKFLAINCDFKLTINYGC